MKIGEGEYRLCLLDTNIYSELAKDAPRYFAGLRAVLGESGWLLCFSPYSLYELRAKPAVYEKFVDIFDVFPCAVLKNEGQLFEAEQEAYLTRDEVDPLLVGFSFFNKEKGTNLRSLLTRVFEDETTLAREAEWPALKLELLDRWQELRKNYPPKGRWYQLHEARPFAKLGTIQQVAHRDPAWARGLRGQGEKLRWDGFPSIAMTLLTVFFRLYEPRNRRPVPQDVFDVLISTPTPYVDVVVTENMQAEILRKARKVFPTVRDVDAYTLRDLRGAA